MLLLNSKTRNFWSILNISAISLFLNTNINKFSELIKTNNQQQKRNNIKTLFIQFVLKPRNT